MEDEFILQTRATTLYSLIAPIMENMQKAQRYSIGARFEQTCLTLLEKVIEGKTTEPVMRFGVKVEVVVRAEIAKVQLRLLMERKLIQEQQYFTWANLLQEVVKLAQGWKNSLRSSVYQR